MKLGMRIFISCAVWFGFLVTAVGAQDWTGWLGPNRDGRAESFKVPEQWSASPKQIWTVEAGTGYGTPLIVGSRVFQHGREGENEVLQCLDLDSGSSIWKHQWPVPFKMGGGGQWHGKGPKSCPIYADGKIVTLSIAGQVVCHDAKTGAPLWSRSYETDYKVTHPYWGSCASPISVDGKLIIHVGNDEAGKLIAFDLDSGEEIWTQGKDGASYSSPLVATIQQVKQVVDWNHNSVVGVDLESGKLLWEFPFPHVGTDQNMPTPAIYKGSIVFGGENRGVLRIEPKIENGTWAVSEVWKQDELALDMSTPVINGNRLFGFSHYDSGRLFCLDLTSGRIIWRGPGRFAKNVTFLTLTNHVVALNDSGELFFIDAKTDDYQVIHQVRVTESPTWAPPVLYQSDVLIKDQTKLTRYRLSK